MLFGLDLRRTFPDQLTGEALVESAGYGIARSFLSCFSSVLAMTVTITESHQCQTMVVCTQRPGSRKFSLLGCRLSLGTHSKTAANRSLRQACRRKTHPKTMEQRRLIWDQDPLSHTKSRCSQSTMPMGMIVEGPKLHKERYFGGQMV